MALHFKQPLEHTAHRPPRPDRLQRRLFGEAALVRERATRPEAATLGYVGEARWLEARPRREHVIGLGLLRYFNQRPRIRMSGCGDDLAHRPGLDDPAEVHH